MGKVITIKVVIGIISYLVSFFLLWFFGNALAPAIILGTSIFLGGAIIDDFSSYLFLKKYGLEKFSNYELDETIKQLVTGFGSIGFLLAEFHPKSVYPLCIRVLLFLLVVYPLNYFIFHYYLISLFIFSLSFNGFFRLGIGGFNFIIFFREMKIKRES